SILLLRIDGCFQRFYTARVKTGPKVCGHRRPLCGDDRASRLKETDLETGHDIDQMMDNAGRLFLQFAEIISVALRRMEIADEVIAWGERNVIRLSRVKKRNAGAHGAICPAGPAAIAFILFLRPPARLAVLFISQWRWLAGVAGRSQNGHFSGR